MFFPAGGGAAAVFAGGGGGSCGFLIWMGRIFPSEKSSSAEEESWPKLSLKTQKSKSMLELLDRRYCSMGTTLFGERSCENEIRGLITRLGPSGITWSAIKFFTWSLID